MPKSGLGIVLLVVASSLVTQLGCVSPSTGEVVEPPPAPVDAAEGPSPAEQRVTALEAEVAALEAEVAALKADAVAVLSALSETEAAARAAERMAGAAQAETARAQAVAAAAEAAAGAAQTETARAQAAAAAAEAAAGAAQAKVDSMMMAARHPSAIMITADRLDTSLLNLDSAHASLAGPDSIYVSSIRYDGQSYSALLKYHGGTTATVERIFGPDGKLIPDSVGLAQTELAFVAPDVLDISYVEVGGQGYSGQLRYAGDNRLQVVGIRRVALPPTAAEQVAAAEAAAAAAAEAQAAAAAAIAEAQAAAAAAVAAAQAAADAAVREAQAAGEAAAAEADAARAQVAEAQAAAGAAQAKVDMMMAQAPSGVMVSADQLEVSRLNLDSARVSLAGPDSIYVSSIRYDGESYSALLKYQGGTTATVEQVFGPQGVLIPSSVGLAQTELAFVAPDVVDISYVEVAGQGYSGQLRYAGDNRLAVAGIQRVTLPPTAAQQVAAAEAAAAAALADAQAAASAAVADAQAAAAAAMREAEAAAAAAKMAAAETVATQAEVDVLVQDLRGRRVAVPAGVDLNLLNLDSARVSVAGPDSIYIAGIGYGEREFAARLRYTGDNEGILEALYDASAGRIPNLNLSTPAFEVVAPDKLIISNVGIGGGAYTVSLQVSLDGAIVITTKEQGHRVRTSAELKRDDLLRSADVNRIVSGFGTGNALPGEGSWSVSRSGTVIQTDAGASHAKFAIANAAQPEVATLYGTTARVHGDARIGYGLHFLASGTPRSGNTWNYGHSYLVWVTHEPGFYDSDETQVQLYESLDGNRLVWRKSRNVAQPLLAGLTLEALYDPEDCPETTGGGACHGSIAVLVDGAEQFKVAVSAEIAQRSADTVALRTLGGPVEFSDLYVHSR